MGSSAQATSLVAAQNQRLRRWVRIAALLLVTGTPLLIGVYLVDQHTDPGLTLAQRSIVELEGKVRQEPNNISLRLKLAAAYEADSRVQDATKQYDEVITAAPDNVTALLAKAGILQTAGDLPGASTLYSRVIGIRKDGEMAGADTQLQRAFYGAGSIAVAQGDWTSAIAKLESAVRIDGTDADAWYLLGKAQLGAGDSERAIQAERNAVAFVPFGWADPYAVLQQAYTAAGKPASASWAQAMTDLIAKRTPEAKALLLTLINGPAAADADVGLGFIAEMSGDDPGAIEWYRRALAADPQNRTARDGVARLGGDPSAAPRAS